MVLFEESRHLRGARDLLCVGGVGDECLLVIGSNWINFAYHDDEGDEEEGHDELEDVSDHSSLVEQPVLKEKG